MSSGNQQTVLDGAAEFRARPEVQLNACTAACSATRSACDALCECHEFLPDYYGCLAGCFAEETACKAECWWSTGVFHDPCDLDPDAPICQTLTQHKIATDIDGIHVRRGRAP